MKKKKSIPQLGTQGPCAWAHAPATASACSASAMTCPGFDRLTLRLKPSLSTGSGQVAPSAWSMFPAPARQDGPP